MSLVLVIMYINKNNIHKVKIHSKMQGLIRSPIKRKMNSLEMRVSLKHLATNQK
jgi:hypothetical protein